MKSNLGDNLAFSGDEFKNTVKNALEGSSLINPASEYSINILLTDIRTRSAFSAIML